jgi:hypothetical protein
MACWRRVNDLLSLYTSIIQYFSYVESARQLEHETNLDVSKYDVCDNIDLDTILQEYELVFFEKKFFIFLCNFFWIGHIFILNLIDIQNWRRKTVQELVS